MDGHRMAELENLIADLRTAHFQTSMLQADRGGRELAVTEAAGSAPSPSSNPTASEIPALQIQVCHFHNLKKHIQT